MLRFLPSRRRSVQARSASGRSTGVLAAAMATALALPILFGPSSTAAQGISLIRDAEMEYVLRVYATPLLQVAGVDPNAVTIYIVNDSALNAFVAGGQNLFFHTGLLRRAASANQVLGVIAHEIGHISGGHLARLSGELENQLWKQLAAGALGLLAGVATGRADVGLAALQGGQSMAFRNLLGFTRVQESSADQAGLRYLEATRQSARGFYEFLNILSGQEVLASERQDPYVRTHPLTRERVETVRAHIDRSPFTNAPADPVLEEAHRRIQAKITAYLDSSVVALRTYREGDRRIEARYGRAIALYRQQDTEPALSLLDGLLADRPQDPFFHELRGEILFNRGRPRDAEPAYRRALEILPGHPLFLLQLGQVLIDIGNRDKLEEAKTVLERVRVAEPENRTALYHLSIAYGRLGDLGMSALSTAELNALRGNIPEARQAARRAIGLLPSGSPGWIRANDILESLKDERDR